MTQMIQIEPSWSRGALALARVLGLAGRFVVEGQRSRNTVAEGPARAHRCAQQMLRALDARVAVSGGPIDAPALYVANHRSYLDIIALLSVFPARFVAKAEVARWPVFGAAVTQSDTLFVDRADRADRQRVRDRIQAALTAGKSVVVFPEGTTHASGLGAFKRGAFDVAQAAGVPVVPVALEYPTAAHAWVGDDTFVAHFMRTIGAGPTHIAVAFGAPILQPDPADTQAACRRFMGAHLRPDPSCVSQQQGERS